MKYMMLLMMLLLGMSYMNATNTHINMSVNGYTGAQDHWAQVVADNPRDASALYNFGVAAFKQRDMASARKAFEKAVEISDLSLVQQEQAYFNLGTSCAQLKDYTKALEYYEKVLSIHPEHEKALRNRELVKKLLDEEKQEQQKKHEHDASKDPQTSKEHEPNANQEGQKDQGNQQGDKHEGNDSQNDSSNDTSEQSQTNANTGTNKSKEQAQETDNESNAKNTADNSQQGKQEQHREYHDDQSLDKKTPQKHDISSYENSIKKNTEQEMATIAERLKALQAPSADLTSDEKKLMAFLEREEASVHKDLVKQQIARQMRGQHGHKNW